MYAVSLIGYFLKIKLWVKLFLHFIHNFITKCYFNKNCLWKIYILFTEDEMLFTIYVGIWLGKFSKQYFY